MVLPAMGVVSELVCQFARKNMFSYTAIVISTIGITFGGFLTWGHHMFTSGMSSFDAGVFGILSMFVAIFSAIKVFNWTATLYKGDRKSTRLNSSHVAISYAVFCLKKKRQE